MTAVIQEMNLSKGRKTSLTAKLNETIGALLRGDRPAAKGTLNAFLNEVAARRGKDILVADADGLIKVVERLIGIS